MGRFNIRFRKQGCAFQSSNEGLLKLAKGYEKSIQLLLHDAKNIILIWNNEKFKRKIYFKYLFRIAENF